jgi:hypothetical protein
MTNPSPQFRPRKTRQAPTKTPWVKYAMFGFAGALLIAIAAIVIVQFVGSDDDGDIPGATPGPDSRSTAGSADDRAEVQQNPAFLFNIQLDDVEEGYEISDLETYGITGDGFASGDYFSTVSAGELAAEEWGYLEGFQTSLQPIGESAAVAQGAHYVRSEVYRFETVEGAAEAYAYLARFHTQQPGSVVNEMAPLGNESSAFTIISDTVPGTELPGAYHRFIGLRGNIVYIAQVFGADQYTSPDQARDYAVIIDEKIIGDREATPPTPTPVNSGSGAAPTLELPPSTTPTP